MASPNSSGAIDVEILRQLLSYDPATGTIRWLVHRGSKIKPGDMAGGLNSGGYVEIMVDGKHCKGHRIAWALTYGYWPAWPIDHIDGNRSNNAIVNLREITPAGNAQNIRSPRKSNQTGFLGVWRRGDRFSAEIRAGGVTTRLGTFDTPEEAHAAYVSAKLKLHTEAML